MKKLFLVMIIASAMGYTMFAGDMVKFSGQFRHRYEYSATDFDSSTDADTYALIRTRLNIAFQPSDNLEVFFQYQDSRKMGEETSTLNDGSADNLDLHQGYVKIDNLFELPFDMKLGRYEVIYGPQRFMGAVGWHNIGRSWDGVTFTYHNPAADIDFFNLKMVEGTNPGSGIIDDSNDVWVRGAYGNVKLEDYTTQAFYILDDERGTFGLYAKGSIMESLIHETEVALQNGSLSGDDLNGLFYAFSVTYDLNGIRITAGYDHVSGDDPETADNEAFSTLYATNHKYYGYMDYFLNLPLDTNQLGLNDLQLKLSGISLMGIAIKADYHLFTSEFEDATGNTDFGSEIDLTLIKKYNENIKFVGGLSTFIPGDLKTGEDNATWAYLMTLVNI